MTLRDNVRNFLVGLTIVEVQQVLKDSVERGETRRSAYIKEFYDDLCEEFRLDEDGPGGDDCIAPAKIY